MTNDFPNEGGTSTSALKSRSDFNYSTVWPLERPSVRTWTEVNYRDGVLSPYWLWVGASIRNGKLSKVIMILILQKKREKKRERGGKSLEMSSETVDSVLLWWFITQIWAE